MRTSTFSHCGNHQNENHDGICINESAIVIADGMGGLPRAREAAEFAANKAASYLHTGFQKNSRGELLIERILTIVNKKLITQHPGSGTTLSMLVTHQETVWCGNVGDSKTYVIRDGVISKISVDQNLTEKSGLSLHGKILTNYIGLVKRLPAFIQSFPLVEDSTDILCTDGVADAIDIQVVLSGHETCNPQIISKFIETAAYDVDPKDNYSAVVVRL